MFYCVFWGCFVSERTKRMLKEGRGGFILGGELEVFEIIYFMIKTYERDFRKPEVGNNDQ